jgi:DNA-binding PadR family transcriptional regulator
MRLLTEKDYIVLAKIFDSKNDKGFSKATGSTIHDIKLRTDETNTKISESKIRDALSSLLEYGYVEYGIKKIRQNTYFITAQGMDNLRKINIKSVKIVKEGV